jgi:hypothetical protein
LIENQDINIVGGSGSIFGALAGGTISVLNGKLTFSGGNQLLDDDIVVSSAAGRAGGDAVINVGLVQVNTTRSITGAIIRPAPEPWLSASAERRPASTAG